MKAPSATKTVEMDLVRFVFGSRHIQFHLLPLLGLTEPTALGFEVERPVMPEGHRVTSELDVLACPIADSSRAVGIQCKRVIVPADAFHTETPGKLNDLAHGVEQTNALSALGFHAAFLAVLVLVDGRAVSGGRWADGGMSSALDRKVGSWPALDDLLPQCGLLIVQIVQPVDRPIFEAGGVSPVLHRRALPRTQDADLTARVGRWLADTESTRAPKWSRFFEQIG